MPFSFEEGLSHTFYPLLPDSFTQNQNIIDWYITELKGPFKDSVNTKSFLSHDKSIVTFKDLQKVIQAQSHLFSEAFDNRTLERLRVSGHCAFWYWEKKTHKARDIASKGDCFFNHIIGLPGKDGIEKPLFGEIPITHSGSTDGRYYEIS